MSPAMNGNGVHCTDAAPPPILTRDQVLERMGIQNKHKNTAKYRAFYSSIAGGITLDPTAMGLPMDDHMVHRGHAVFDTAIIHRGNLYELEEHLDRFSKSASNAKIRPHYSRDHIRDTIFATAAASGLEEGYLRYWLSAGPGGFAVSSEECTVPSLYVLAIAEPLVQEMKPGVSMVTAKTPMKSPMMSTTKSVNYLPNALLHLEAMEAGVFEALWIDEKGNIAEGPSMNVAFVSSDGYFLVPSFERILPGCTMKRVLKLSEELVQLEASKSSPLLKGVKHGPVPESEARKAVEMVLVGSGVQVMPVTEWDGVRVGDGTPGVVAITLHKMLLNAYETTALTPIPKVYF